MNYDLAIMALDGLTASPMTVTVAGGEVSITASAASFRELARLCLLLGGEGGDEGGGFELQPGVHVQSGSPMIRLERTHQLS